MTLRIEDYAFISDCETGALVGRDGSIDWLCWPRFDSGACFAALLGRREHGRWLLAPADPHPRVTRRYRESTMILETEFETDEGAVRVIDCMPLRDHRSDVVRVVEGVRGRVPMRTEILLRFDYGSFVPWVSRLDDGRLRAIAGPDMVLVASDVELHGEDFAHAADFAVSAGERVSFSMTWSPSHLRPARAVDGPKSVDITEHFWRHWVRQCAYTGEYEEAVTRSLLTLKALAYTPTGGIVAAPTTSLPECIGGSRNWDYRFCWLRDATLSLLALMNAGYFYEAGKWRDWLLRAAAGVPDQVQIMYGLAGERLLREWEVSWLPGYEGSSPVRVGNGAHGQLQLDVFGEVMDALHQARLGGIAEEPQAWQLQQALIGHLEDIWKFADQGIWEVRGPPQQFTHSKIMAWVAADRMVRSAEQFHLDGPIDRWRALRQEIHDDVCAHGYDAQLGSFVQAYGTKQLDAGLLMIPLVGFLPASDPRVRGTVAAIERGLMKDGFVLRYDTTATNDGLPAGEGAFLACSFWLADNYVLLGRHDDARALFERLIGLRNDVGLLAEEYDPVQRRQVGNFPQAFSHVALLSTAFNLTRAAENAPRPAEQRTGVTAPQPT